MKKSFLLATLSIFSLGIFACEAPSYADILDECSSATSKNIINTCIDADRPVTLGSDINLEGYIVIRAGKNVTIDLAGHNITQPADSPVFQLREGSLALKGTGTIETTSESGPAISVYGSTNSTAPYDYSYLHVGENVTVKNSENYAIFVNDNNSGAEYGIKVDFLGKIFARDGIAVSRNINTTTNSPKISIDDGAVIDVTNHPVLAEGYASWAIGAASLKGNSGLGIVQGDLFIAGADVLATGPDNPAPVPNGPRIGMGNSGAAIQIEATAGLTDRSSIYIMDGIFTSEHGYAIVEYAADEFSETASIGSFRIQKGILKGTHDFDSSVATSDTGAFFWFYSDGRLLEDGSYVLEDDYDTDYEHTMTVERYALVSGLTPIYSDPRYEDVSRLLPVYTPYDGLSESQEEALAASEYSNFHIKSVFDLSLRMFINEIVDPTPGMSPLYYPITDTGEEYPITFTMPLVGRADGLEEGYVRQYYVLNFHLIDPRTGEYEIEKLPVFIYDDDPDYAFSTHKFSTFALAYEDTKLIPEPEEPEPETPEEETPGVPDAGENSISTSLASALPVPLFSILFCCFFAIRKISRRR